ncbi:MAG: glycosyltransferase family 39 protein [Endomicrobium sp.]|jgi:4-amino-4-deoxy-L-arabinose transferase-like glycosyltransferase|nr:glycosyltransferase family 39 protein [Endomicrobium sp.]
MLKIKNIIVSFFTGNISFGRNFLFISLLLIMGYIFFNNLGVNPLSTDGYYYANVSKTMVRSNDFLTLTYNNEPNFEDAKGVFFYWMNAVCGYVFGFNSFAMRFPSAVLGFICILFMFLILEKKYDYKFAFISSMVLLFTQQFLYHSRTIYPDGNFAVFFTFTVMTFYIAVTEDKPVYYYLFGFFLAISILIRQAMGLFILPVVFCYVMSIPDRRKIIFNKHLYFSLLLTAIIVMPWYILAYRKYGDFFLKQYLATPYKILTGIQVNESPFVGADWWSYIDILSANYEPWLIFMLIGAFVITRKVIGDKLIFSNSFEKFVIIWGFLPLILFHCVKGYQPHFIVPIYVPFAIVSTSGLLYVFKNRKNAIISYLLLISIIISFLCFSIKFLPRTLDNQHYINTISLIPKMMEIKDQIYTTEKPKFYTCVFLFYANRDIKHVSSKEFDDMIRSNKKYYFVLYKSTFNKEVVDKYDVNIIAETKEDVLFSNNILTNVKNIL